MAFASGKRLGLVGERQRELKVNSAIGDRENERHHPWDFLLWPYYSRYLGDVEICCEAIPSFS